MLSADEAVLRANVNWPRTAKMVRGFVEQATARWEHRRFGGIGATPRAVTEAATEVQQLPEFAPATVAAQVEAGVKAGAPYETEARVRKVRDRAVRDVANRYGRKLTQRAVAKVAATRAEAAGTAPVATEMATEEARSFDYDPSIIAMPGYVSPQPDRAVFGSDQLVERIDTERLPESAMVVEGMVGLGLIPELLSAAAGIGTSLLQQKQAEEAAKAAKRAAEKAAAAQLALAREQTKQAQAAAKAAAAAGAASHPLVPWWAWVLGAGGIVLLLGGGAMAMKKSRG